MCGTSCRGPRLWFIVGLAGEPGSQGDHGQLCEWARPTAVRSAHDGFAFAAWLCKRAVFVAAHCESLLRAERFRDDCRAHPPDFRTISDFRKRHLKALGELFLQVLKLCETAGLVKLGHVALDGTKIKANASKHKAMSYERMKKREAELKAEVACMLAAAEAADVQEDEIFGKDKRGDEMPDWANDKEKRLAKIQEAMATLEADASWPRRKSVASRPKNNSSATLKAARSRANRRHHYRTNLIPRRNATSPIRTAAL